MLTVFADEKPVSQSPPIEADLGSVEPDPRKRWIRLGLRSVIALLAVYAVAAAVVLLMQDRLVFPGTWTQNQPTAQMPALQKDLVKLTTAKGQEITVYYAPALLPDGAPHPGATTRPTIIYFYGNNMCLRDSVLIAGQLRRLGMNVLVPEYVGYGLSKGDASEENCYATADAAYDYLLSRHDVDRQRIVAAGFSLGGAMAIDLASRRPCAAVASFCTFTSIGDLNSVPATWWLLRPRFENERKLEEIHCPVFIAHGRKDAVVPFEMSDRLAAAAEKAHAPLTRITLDDAGHEDFFERGDRKLLADFRQFVEEATRQ